VLVDRNWAVIRIGVRWVVPQTGGVRFPRTVAVGLLAGSLVAGCSGSGSPERLRATPSANPTTPDRVTLVATGDVLLHQPLWRQARADAGRTSDGAMDFAPMLAGLRPVVSRADLAICHLETPLARRSGPFAGYPRFAGPPQIAPALAATGYDACSTASNHTFDGGSAGIRRTLDALDAAGLEHAGSARTEREAARTTLLDVHGVRVALLSFSFGFNGIGYPGGDRWRARLIERSRILAAARQARRKGAEIVVLALHWGTEYQHRPNAQQLALAPILARAPDIDLVIGHHAHVVQPIEKIGRTWVVYGMGNLIAWHATPGAANAEGLLVRFTLTRTTERRFRVSAAEYRPLVVAKGPPVRVLDVARGLARRSYGSSTRARLTAALNRTQQVVESRGGRSDGLSMMDP
jgi:poly-gamma-glutamate synthesis protein (capsule biosynthesis protein)